MRADAPGGRDRFPKALPFYRKVFFLFIALFLSVPFYAAPADALASGFRSPPPSARPWVYWMWMDGNLTREGITADLEAMQRVGIGGVIIMEVNVGIPQGPVKFMGPEWRALFKHVASEAARLGLEIDLNASPGWTGSGGPWVKPEQSMQKVVFSETNIVAPQRFAGVLAQPPSLEGFYRDVAVLAFPTPEGNERIANIAEKALFHRGHYSSERGVASSIPVLANYESVPSKQMVAKERVVELSQNLGADGRLNWEVPPGRWTILRFGRTTTGANTRPAPAPGLGLECDKLDKTALDAHFQEFIGKLIGDIGALTGKSLVSLHIDSWEMGPQNWTARFREEFQRLRGYDTLLYLPVMTGRIVQSLEVSERFLWDLRQTVQDLIIENHARHLRSLAHQHGISLSIEPYDGTPCDDLTLGAVADVPMCEFWMYGFNTSFTCTEATSIAHTYGQRLVAAEAFTSSNLEAWQAHPGSMKALGDWAFSAGINRFVFHRYQHQPWLDRWPGMTMGPYGVHHERTQTWWEMSSAYHAYLARCQYMLQQGLAVADICYLSPEGAPNVFHPPISATRGTPPDRLGYNFDGCTPEVLLTRMRVQERKLILPDGMSYHVLVLPERETMTPALLRKLQTLVQAGAIIVGPRPSKSPSLAGYPECDQEVQKLAGELWGQTPGSTNKCGEGRVIWPAGKPLAPAAAKANPLQTAKWIWYAEGQPAASAPVGTRFFRRVFTLPANNRVESARITLTADNAFELWLNGQAVGTGDNLTELYEYDILSFIKPGTNLMAVAAFNGAQTPNPAGLIGKVIIKYQDAGTLVLETDARWEASLHGAENWTSSVLAEAPWKTALELGPLGMAPWGKTKPLVAPEEDYVSYDFVAGVLGAMALRPDFESDIRLRYAHRREGTTDIYFVANPVDRAVSATCAFRVSDKQPELWDPLTNEQRALLDYQQQDARTVVPLRFEPHQSFFIVFRNRVSAKPAGTNFPELRRITELPGPWEVSFDPKWGGPEKITFQHLEDWTKRAEDGIRYYSGTATYRKVFNAPELANAGKTRRAGERVYLDLGAVNNLARIRLNGKDLGVLWCAPWRVDVTETLRAGNNNQLEISVVNLWPNRLIGDEHIPADSEYVGDGELARLPEWLLKNQPRPSTNRFTFTTWKHFSKSSRLLPSGLLGPVSLQQ